MIDPRAIVDPAAELGRNVVVGPWAIVGPDVEIGDDCEIAPHAIVKGPTVIGRGNRIFPFAVVGEDTPALAYSGERTRLVIGDGNVIREGVTIHRGTVQDRGETRIGDHNLLMAYVHVAHDCRVGDCCIFANNASISGHVHVGDHANFGGYAGVPQYRRIGAYAMIGGMSLVLKDVPAFVSVSGNPARAIGVNVEGMRRHGFEARSIKAVREAYQVLYRERRRLPDALATLEARTEREPLLAELCRSVRGSRFGIVRPRLPEQGGEEGPDGAEHPDAGGPVEGDPFAAPRQGHARSGR